MRDAAAAAAARRSPAVTFGAVAAAVLAIDAATKHLAPLLASRGAALGDWARFTVLHNDRLTGGVSLGAATVLAHAAVLLGLVALMAAVCRPLSDVDDSAPLWLGLLAGAALGNGVEVVAGAGGATDFLALRYAEGAEVVGNLADVAACVGLALLVRGTGRIALAIRRTRHAVVVPAVTPTVARERAAYAGDVAVPLHVYRETAVDVERPARRRQRPNDGRGRRTAPTPRPMSLASDEPAISVVDAG